MQNLEGGGGEGVDTVHYGLDENGQEIKWKSLFMP